MVSFFFSLDTGQVSSTGNEFQHSTTLIVTLNDRHPPTAFEILVIRVR